MHVYSKSVHLQVRPDDEACVTQYRRRRSGDLAASCRAVRQLCCVCVRTCVPCVYVCVRVSDCVCCVLYAVSAVCRVRSHVRSDCVRVVSAECCVRCVCVVCVVCIVCNVFATACIVCNLLPHAPCSCVDTEWSARRREPFWRKQTAAAPDAAMPPDP